MESTYLLTTFTVLRSEERASKMVVYCNGAMVGRRLNPGT